MLFDASLLHAVNLAGPGQDTTWISGTVDAVSADGSLIWLVQDDCAGRRIFHQVDGYKTLLDPAASQPSETQRLARDQLRSTRSITGTPRQDISIQPTSESLG